MAREYGMLPHQVDQNATTYDMMVTDVLATYERYQQQKATGKPMDPSIYKFTEAELQAMNERANNVE
jgi:hypothetical protein